MNFTKEIWAVIPARSGSKSIKNKNIKSFSGKPLIAQTIIVAKKLKKVKKIIFSSDSQKYYNIAKRYGKIEFHKRSKKNSLDSSTDLDLFKEIISYFKYKKVNLPEFLIHLRPTTPLRKKKHLDKAIKILISKKKSYDSLRSLTQMSQTSFKTFRIVNGKISGLIKKDFNIDKFNLPRKKYESTYEANGIIDIYKTKNILNGSLSGNRSFPYVIDYINSDINTLKDFKIFEIIIKKK